MIRTLLSRCGTICKFASSSLLSFALDYGLFLLFSAAAGPWTQGILLGNVTARLISACFNYSLNKYLVLAAGILIANSILLQTLTALGLAAPVAKLFTEAALFAVSFSVQTLVIFRRRRAGKEGDTVHVRA